MHDHPPRHGLDNLASSPSNGVVTSLPPRSLDNAPTGPPDAEAHYRFISRDVGETQAWLIALLRRDLLLEALRTESFEAKLTGHALARAHLVHACYPWGMRLKRGDAHDNLTLRIVASGAASIRSAKKRSPPCQAGG